MNDLNDNEFEHLIIKEERDIVVDGSPEDVELKKNEKVIKREYISDDEDCLNKFKQEKEEIEMNTDEFGELVIKKEFVTVVGLPEDVELGKNEEMLKREYIPNDEDPLNTNEEILNEKEGNNCLLKKNELPYKCPECGKHFQTSKAFKMHRCIHLGWKPLDCTVCGRRFLKINHFEAHQLFHLQNSSNSLIKEILNEGGNNCLLEKNKLPFKCPECGKHFQTSNALKVHRNVHPGWKPRDCPVCGRRFLKINLFESHLRFHLQAQQPSDLREQVVHSRKKKHECSICKKQFPRKGSLNRHMVIHSDTKSFECPECKKCFRSKNTLDNHLLIHSDTKPFQCPDCKRRFRHKYSLDKHLLIHSGVKPYECSECGKFFRQLGSLKSHRKNKH